MYLATGIVVTGDGTFELADGGAIQTHSDALLISQGLAHIGGANSVINVTGGIIKSST